MKGATQPWALAAVGVAIAVLVVLCGPAHAVSFEDIGGPSALWSTVSVPGGQPTYGLRRAIYAGSTAPGTLVVPLWYNTGITSPPSLQVQYRVTTASGDVPYSGLFFARSNTTDFGASCATLLLLRNDTVVEVPRDNVTSAEFAQASGSLVTCSYNTYPSGTWVKNYPAAVKVQLYLPTSFDAVDYFDILFWSSSTTGTIWGPVSTYSSFAAWVSLAPGSQGVPFADADLSQHTEAADLYHPFIYNVSSGIDELTWIKLVQPKVAYNSSAAITLHATTATDLSTVSSSSCLMGNIGPSYVMERHAPGAAITGASMGYSEPPSPECADGITYTATQMMQMCDDDPLCVGFFTTMGSRGAELGHCFLTPRPLNRTQPTVVPAITSVRLVHWKRLSILALPVGCTVVVGEAQDLSVYIMSPNVEAVVLVNDLTALRCSRGHATWPCDAYYLCGTVTGLQAGWTVRVAPTRVNTFDGVCEETDLSVLFKAAPISTSAVHANTPQAAATLLATKSAAASALATAAIFRDVVVSPTTSAFSIYALGLASLKVQVQQSTFGSALSFGSAVSFTAAAASSSSVSCGGTSGFALGASGWSNRCDVWAGCPDSILTSDYIGYVNVAINWTLLRSSAVAPVWWCRGGNLATAPSHTLSLRFLGEPVAASPFASQGGWLGTTLSTAADRALAPLVLLPNTTSPTSSLASIELTRSYQYLVRSHLNFAHLSAYARLEGHTYQGDEILACAVDVVGYEKISCVFPIQSASTLVNLLVEDSNLADVGVQWIVQAVASNGTTRSIRTGSCGGTAGYLDGSAAAGNCGFLRTCISFRTDSTLYAGLTIQLVVVVPREVMAPRTLCPPFAFFAVLNATTDALSDDACNGFTCISTGDCIDLNRVCDGVTDCGDNADEENCFNWYPVELNATLSTQIVFNSSEVSDGFFPPGYNIISAKDCRVLALRNASHAIAFNDATKECVAYAFTAPTYTYDFTASLVVLRDGYIVYSVLSTTLQYGVCSDRLTCSGHGTAGAVYGQNYPCGCVCDALYRGSACSDYLSLRADFSQLVVSFDVTLSSSYATTLNKTSVVSALKRWLPLGRFSCLEPIRSDASTVQFICTDSSGLSNASNVGSLAAVATFNGHFASFGPPGLKAQILAPTSVPRLEAPTGCLYLFDRFDCVLPAPTDTASLSFSTSCWFNCPSAPATLKVNVTFRSTTRRRAGTVDRTIAVPCPSASLFTSLTSSSQKIQSCSLSLADYSQGEPMVSFMVYLEAADGSLLALTSSGVGATSALLQRKLSVPVLYRLGDPVTSQENFSIWMWLGIAFVSLGVVLSIVVLALGIIYYRHLRRVLHKTEADDTQGVLHRVVAALFLQITMVDIDDPMSSDDETASSSSELADPPPTQTTVVVDADGRIVHEVDHSSRLVRRSTAFPRVNRRKYAFCCASFWLTCWIAAVFFLLYYVTSSGIRSDTWLAVERYATPLCENATFSSIPQAVFYISDDTAVDCKRRKIAGVVTNGFYISGFCFANGTNVVARYRSGLTKDACEAAEWTEVLSDSCVPSLTLWGTEEDPTYTRMACGSISSTTNRFDFLQIMSAQTQPAEAARVESTDSDLSSIELAQAGGYERTMLRKAGRYDVVTASTSNFETSGVSSNLLPSSGQQLYIQDYDELFKAPASPSFYSPNTAAIESAQQARVTSYMSDPSPLASISSLLPPYSLPELPIGQIYGYMNRSTELVGAAAGVTSSRYYGARRTIVDIGAFIDSSTMVDEQGFTIAFNLRATPETFGFAFAATDAFEDQVDGSSPILDLMISMIQRNAGADSWFSDDYHIYHSLFVDGPSQQLHYIYASPAEVFGQTVYTVGSNRSVGQTMGVLTWELEDLGLQRVLNGLWHSIRIIIRMETNLLKVQLVVDGETSRSRVGWNQCLGDDPRPIVHFPPGKAVNQYKSTNQVSTGAILWTGYFNGGVGNIQYLPYVEDIFTIWKGSSLAIQRFNGINKDAYTILGYCMCLLGAFLFVVMFLTSGRDMYMDAQRAERALVQGVFLRYAGIMTAMPGEYDFLKYTTAKRWLNLSDAQFSQFLDEVQNTTSATAAELHRVLFLAGDALLKGETRDIHMRLPSEDEWARLITDDENRYIADHTSGFPFYREGRPEADPFQLPPKRTLDKPGAAVSTKGRDEGEEIVAVENMASGIARTQVQFKQEGEIGAVSTGNLTFSSGSTAAVSQLSMKSDTLPNVDIRQLFLPVISVVQEIHLWVASSEIVSEYVTYFGQAFSFLSVDFVTSFSLPTLITPLVQLFVGLVAFLLLLYLSAMDEVRFSWYVARYVLKRDALEMTASAVKKPEGTSGTAGGNSSPISALHVKHVMERFKHPFGKLSVAPQEYEVEVLPLLEAMRIDRFLGVAKVTADASESEEALQEIVVKDGKGRSFVLSKNIASASRKGVDQAGLLKVETDAPGTNTCALDVVGVRCREHKSRRLSPQLQTDVWPFVLAPECCVFSNGVRCGVSQGIIYSCMQHTHKDDGSLCMCDYAVCERHYRGGLVDGLSAEVLGVVRTGQQRGAQWVIATIVVLGSNAAYMPFVQTALMIIGCHPTYQCEFTECSINSQKYLLAAFLAFCVIALFGLGLPVMQAVQLRRRRGTLFHVFFADEYKGRYEERDDAKHDEKAVLEKFQRSTMDDSNYDLGESSFRAGSLRAGRQRKNVAAHRGGPVASNTVSALECSGTLPFTVVGCEGDELTEVTNSSPDAKKPQDVTVVQDCVGLDDMELSDAKQNVLMPPPAVAPSCSTPLDMCSTPHGGASQARAHRPGSSLAWVEDAPPGQSGDKQVPHEQTEGESGAEEDKSSHVVLLSEWSRFLASDPTVLGNLYKPLEFEWIYLSPLLLLWKVILVCPAVFLPFSTFEQLVGICCAEVAFAFFIFTTAPFTSSMADMMYKAGNCHQILFLGVRALDTVDRFQGNSGYGVVFVLLTFAYLAFSVICIAWTVVGTQIRKAIDRSTATKALEGLGFQYAPSTSLYVVPAADAVRKFDREAAEGEQQGNKLPSDAAHASESLWHGKKPPQHGDVA